MLIELMRTAAIVGSRLACYGQARMLNRRKDLEQSFSTTMSLRRLGRILLFFK